MVIYVSRQVLLAQPFRERRSLLKSRFPPFLPSDKRAGRLDHVESCESEAGKDAIEEFWQKAIESRTEGLMIKVRWCLNSYWLIGVTNAYLAVK